jgi:two-component system CheB/CheR fusion protein
MVESVPPDLLRRYFEHVNGRYVFRKDLRRAVIFGRNDLVKDAPISHVDLLVCRNTLMYLNAETQRNVLGRFHFALTAQGTLFLGHAEMLLSHADRFPPLNLKHRVFRKAAGSHTGLERYDPAASMSDRHGDPMGVSRVRELAFGASPVAQIVVTGEDAVAMINQQAESMFGLSARDIGRPLRDLEVSYRPVELRAYLEQARVERRSARIQDVKWQRPDSETEWYEIHVNPLVDTENGLHGVSIVFFDVTANRALVDKVVHTNRQLEAAYEELQSTNEELETMNAELQSTNDEWHTSMTPCANAASSWTTRGRSSIRWSTPSIWAWWWSIGRCAWWCGTATARTCGGYALTRPPVPCSRHWTSAYRWRQSGR